MADQSQSAPSSKTDDLRRLLHELQVHQVELEAQNCELRESRQELEESRSRYVDLYDSAPYGYLTFDNKGRIREINLTGAQMLGKGRSYLIGKPFVAYVAKGSAKQFLEHVRRCQQGEEKVMTELMLEGDSARWAQLLSVSAPTGARQNKSFRAALIDVTERRRAEEATNRYRAQLESVFHAIQDGIVVTDMEGAFLLVNEAQARMNGFPSAEAMKQNLAFYQELYELSYPDGRPLPFEEWPINKVLKGESITNWELRARRRDTGQEWFLSFSGEPVCDPQGKQILAVVGTRDITERKRAEEQLIEQAALLNLAQDVIIVRNLNDRAIFWNKSAERIYGWTAEEAVGRDVKEMQFRNNIAEFKKANQAVREKGAWFGEMRQVARDGHELIVDCKWTLVRDGAGNPKSVLAINTDITEKKKLESQFLRAQRLESIGTLASGIAHDLNNVLSPILMCAQMLQMKLEDEQSRRLLRVMQANAERGAEMIKQVLSFARGIGGERVTIQPKHLIREIVRIVEETFPKSIQITQRLSENLWATSGDATQLHQVLMNLCVNARDAMPQGGELTIKAENQSLDEMYAGMLKGASPGNFVLITVADTGKGVPPEIIDRIFDPFFTTKEPGQGTGLGLATVQGIVGNHGGFITVESKPWLGTKFKIYLPAHEAASRKQVEEERPEIPLGASELILVIDDEATIREIARTTLESFGYRVMTADNGATALGVFADHRDEISLVITDMMMPVMNGPLTIRALQKLNPQVCIIASSGLTGSISDADLDQLGVRTLLVKPYDAKALLNTVAQALSQSRQRNSRS